MNEDLSVRMLELEKRLRKRTRLFAGVLGAVVVFLGVMMIRHVKSAGFVSVFPTVIMTERTEGGTVGLLTATGKHTRLLLSEILWTEEAPKKSFTSQPRAELVANDEQTGLLLYDRSGKVRAQLVVSEDQPKLVFLDKSGKVVFSAP